MPSPEEFSCTCETGLGWAFGCSRTGSSHIRTNKSCEDAYALWSGSFSATPRIAVAVADGHGDSRHDLSRIGSALASEAAIAEMVGFSRRYSGDVPTQRFRADFRTDFPRRVTRRWRELVIEDAKSRGDVGSGDKPDSKLPEELFIRYGTTLISALIVKDCIVAAQIGDGDLLMVRPDGTIEFPIPRDTTITGNETRSLSSSDAHLLWRTATFDRGTGGVLIAATDGVSDSFDGSDSEEFGIFVKSLADRISTYGMEPVAGSMSGWLDRYSAIASGDDMTLVYVYIRPDVPEPEDAMKNSGKPDADHKKAPGSPCDDDAVLAWEGW